MAIPLAYITTKIKNTLSSKDSDISDLKEDLLPLIEFMEKMEERLKHLEKK